jgi:hypothetical protein
MASGTVTPAYTSTQLANSSSAATKWGVPVNIVRAVTGYRYGDGATAGNFNTIAQQLHSGYASFYKKTGNALNAWINAAKQAMPGASSLQVATAAGNQYSAQTGMLLSPAIVDAVTGGVDVGAAAATDATTGAPTAAEVNAATGADSAAAGAESGAAGAGAGSTLANLGKAAVAATTAGELANIWKDIKGDFDYGVVTVALILFGALLMYRAFSGGGGGGKIRVVPV